MCHGCAEDHSCWDNGIEAYSVVIFSITSCVVTKSEQLMLLSQNSYQILRNNTSSLSDIQFLMLASAECPGCRVLSAVLFTPNYDLKLRSATSVLQKFFPRPSNASKSLFFCIMQVLDSILGAINTPHPPHFQLHSTPAAATSPNIDNSVQIKGTRM